MAKQKQYGLLEIELREAIADRLVELRRLHNQSQRDVYYQTEVRIDRIESRTTNPTVRNIAILCNHFNISLEDFFQGIVLNKHTK